MEKDVKKVLPVVVSDTKELDTAVSNKEKVIIIINKDLFPAIKKNVTKDSKFHKRSGKALKISGLALVGGTAVGIFTPLVVPAAVAMLAGIYGACGSGIAKFISAISGKLRKYEWFESDDKEMLILMKVEGENKFEMERETIDFEHARK